MKKEVGLVAKMIKKFAGFLLKDQVTEISKETMENELSKFMYKHEQYSSINQQVILSILLNHQLIMCKYLENPKSTDVINQFTLIADDYVREVENVPSVSKNKNEVLAKNVSPLPANTPNTKPKYVYSTNEHIREKVRNASTDEELIAVINEYTKE